MRYYRITNADGKTWVMPSENMQTGMMLYQPSSFKGKILKRLFPYSYWCRTLRKKLGIESTLHPVNDSLRNRLEKCFRTNDLEYSYFGGTPCAHQKATIQVYKGKQILGYCKVSESDDIYRLFKHEKVVLDELNGMDVHGIPSCIFCGELAKGYYVFVQSTIKTLQSKYIHSLTDNAIGFLTDLKACTAVTCRFSDTDEYKWIKLLVHDKLSLLGDHERTVVCKSVEILDGYFRDRECIFSAYHGDFTPWNMFEEQGKLFVFDFEYAGLRYIPFLDIFHSMTQIGIFEKGWNAHAIYEDFMKREAALATYFENVRIAYIAYLVDITAKFICREKNSIPKGTQRLLDVWIPLMEKLN